MRYLHFLSEIKIDAYTWQLIKTLAAFTSILFRILSEAEDKGDMILNWSKGLTIKIFLS